MKTEAELEALAIADFKKHYNKILLVYYINGYLGDSDVQHEVFCHPPLAVKVVGPLKPNQGLLHWNDNYLDPYWDVEIVDQTHPSLPKEGLRSAWMDGPSYHPKTGKQEISFQVEGLWARLRRKLRRRAVPTLDQIG